MFSIAWLFVFTTDFSRGWVCCLTLESLFYEPRSQSLKYSKRFFLFCPDIVFVCADRMAVNRGAREKNLLAPLDAPWVLPLCVAKPENYDSRSCEVSFPKCLWWQSPMSHTRNDSGSLSINQGAIPRLNGHRVSSVPTKTCWTLCPRRVATKKPFSSVLFAPPYFGSVTEGHRAVHNKFYLMSVASRARMIFGVFVAFSVFLCARI